MITPHINSQKSDFSDLVLVSGDPERIRYIAENFLENIKQVSSVRCALGFTGYYKNKKVSLMSHGMGIPSAAIYIEELIKFYNIKKIVRVGTCGTVHKNINIKDILIAMGACTDSKFNRIRFQNYDFSSIADFKMVYNAFHIANSMKISVNIGNFFTTDAFYSRDNKIYKLLEKYNIIGIDMETAGIYSIASEFSIPCISICFVSDHITFRHVLSVKERSLAFDNIINIALESIIL